MCPSDMSVRLFPHTDGSYSFPLRSGEGAGLAFVETNFLSVNGKNGRSNSGAVTATKGYTQRAPTQNKHLNTMLRSSRLLE